jgi:hypothetical protein
MEGQMGALMAERTLIDRLTELGSAAIRDVAPTRKEVTEATALLVGFEPCPTFVRNADGQIEAVLA